MLKIKNNDYKTILQITYGRYLEPNPLSFPSERGR